MIHALTYTGDGSKQTIAALLVASGNYTSAQALAFRPKWLQVVGEGAGTARLGDVNTSVSYGLPIASTAGQAFPPGPQPDFTYGFGSVYLFTPNGTVVSLIFDA